MPPIKALFTHRHRAALFETKTLKPSFSRPLRTGIERVLARCSDGSEHENWTYDNATEMLRTVNGRALTVQEDDGRRREASFSDMILLGYPSQLLDAVEAWFACGPNAPDLASHDLNTLLAIHGSDWRFVAGEAVLIDSAYLHDELVANTADLLGKAKAAGPLQEFQAATSALQGGDHKRAVVEAHKSVESVMKHVLATHEHWPFGRLLAEVIKSGLLPDYYEDFLRHFEMLALGAVKARNRPGAGHGQGSEEIEVPRSLAQFAIHLAGCINVFLLEHWIERQGKQAATTTPEEDLGQDVPF